MIGITPFYLTKDMYSSFEPFPPCECTRYVYAAEGAMKARREIADYMKSGRIERARIRVSHTVYTS